MSAEKSAFTATLNVNINLGPETRSFVQTLAEMLLSRCNCTGQEESGIQLIGGALMRVVKSTHEGGKLRFILPTEARDAEGYVVPVPELDVTFESTNVEAVRITEDSDGDPYTWNVEIIGPNADGSEAIADIRVIVKSAATGKVLGLFTETIVVTAGDPDSISGGGFVLEGFPDPVDSGTGSDSGSEDGSGTGTGDGSGEETGGGDTEGEGGGDNGSGDSGGGEPTDGGESGEESGGSGSGGSGEDAGSGEGDESGSGEGDPDDPSTGG